MLTWAQVVAWRTKRQHLAARAAGDRALAVTGDVAGLHAQLMGSAELSLWARVERLEPGAVARELWDHRTLCKTWAREELATEVARITGIDGLDGKLRGGFGDLLKPAAFRGDLCFAPNEGRNVRFARPDQWLGPWEPMEADEAVRAVTRRYLAAYGPATRETLARWFGITSPAQAGRWLKALGDEAATVDLEGTPAVMLAEHVEAAAAAEPAGAVRLLPAFDHYVVAAPRDADAVLPAARRARVYRPQGWLSPVLLVDGVMAGVWAHERKGARLEVEIEPFARLAAAGRRAAEAEAEGLAAYLGGELALRWAASR